MSRQKFSEEHKLKISLSHMGDKNPAWKGGRRYATKGYVMIYSPNHPYRDKKGYVTEHRLVMEKHLDRHLQRYEDVHHINGIKDDNRIENLQLILHSEHARLTNLGRRKDVTGRNCINCGSNKTYIDKKDRIHWFKFRFNFLCKTCYTHYKRKGDVFLNVK